MIRFGTILLLVSLTFLHKGYAQMHSVLATGNWYKFAVTESSIYQLTGSDLENAGISISNIDPAKIRLFGTKGGMLPQANSALRPIDLEEIAIEIEDGGDGNFNGSDKILFWGEGPDEIYYNEVNQIFSYENNVYSDTSYYFLNLDQSIGKRIEIATPIVGNFPIIDSYLSYFVHEVDQFNILKSGRHWYGENFESNLDQSFTTTLSNWVIGSNTKIYSSVMAASLSSSQFTISINGINIGNHQIPSIPDPVTNRYAIKGVEDNKTFTTILPTSNGSFLEINYKYEKQGGVGYLNYFITQIEKNLTINSDFVELIIPKKLDLISTLSATTSSSSTKLWNIADFNNVQSIPIALNGSQLTANINTDITSNLILVDPTATMPSPVFTNNVTNQDLHGFGNLELLIVTSSDFLNQANELKDHKASQGISTQVVSTTQVFNEFSSGKKDISAIRDFAKYLYENAGLKHMLLFGKGTYDYKNIDEKNNSFVPIYESRNSLSPLYTYGSDDYLGFMENDEGDWEENLQGDHTMDIGVGRLPVKSIEDAKAVVSKIKHYHTKTTVGDWRKKIYFVAENGDFNIHQRDAERLSTLIDTTYSAFNPQKIYIDAYPIEANPGGNKAPLVNDAISNAFENGAFIINYTGHGSENQWAKSNVFNKDMIDDLTNNDFYPLMVTATCEFGRHDDANQISAGEELVVKPNAGAIGLITTSRPVFASSNYILNLAFYSTVLATENGLYKSLGDIFIETKNNSLSGPNNRNFSLLADPSLKLAYPKQFIKLDSINSNPLQQNDTIKALEKVSFSGSIRGSNGTILSNYNGEIAIRFFDRLTTKQTLGNFGAPFVYSDRDNFLFAGNSTVQNGIFNFQFITPLDISYQIEEGKISMYAVATDSTDANGANITINIGGTISNPPIDSDPPDISLFMEDTTFLNNDLVSTNSLLIAHISDESGINLSKSQVGHTISYSIDGEEPVSLNDFFQYNLDSYQSGKIFFPLQGISPGEHTLTVQAWDTYNNQSEQEIGFYVADEKDAYISEVSVYPNPVRDNANFTFKHNLSGNDLSVFFTIINRSGQTVFTEEIFYENASSVINDIEWNGRNSTGQKLIEGLYIFNIKIRSISSGATDSFFGRLMTVN